ncbi:Hcp family type VI secretion system effector [Pseudomonas sp. P66]|jgi:type VI secretion system Hcp family effector|uniref:Hcp family type VI secretion system effector n=2 Tax=Pseudomonas TaxID=286 RepID=A0ABS2C6T8_9PSED|nr:Hcp family type VI secretion system effector [Pseudomonas arcuscaelestis]MBM3114184.1 Hcp family type VI secretion system effector [Pseudomonas arcuscaelestis]MBM5461594.1 Hcp family type VI secretion system effector [Pseudomonas arcuscaelestis]
MASHGYITITGKTQGLISAGCSSQESIGNKCQAGHADEIMVLAMNHGMTNVGNIKRTTHGPIVITKNIDKSSPLLAQALTNREAIDCTISFYRTSAFGTQEKFYTIKLGEAQVADLIFDMPHAILHSEAEMQEQLSIRYRSIIWTHHLAGTSGSCYWGEDE